MTTEEAIQSIPSDLFWLIGKGRTRPDEPLYGVQIFAKHDDSRTPISEGEADTIADAIHIAVKKLPASHPGV